MQALKNKNIGTQVHYMPIPWQPYWQQKITNNDRSPDLFTRWIGARDYYAQCLSLPLYPTMEDSDVCYVVDQLSTLLSA